MLKLVELLGREQLKTKLDSLNIVIERTVMHQLNKVLTEPFDPQLETDQGGQRGDPVLHYVLLDFIQLHHDKVQVDVQEVR